MPQLDGHEKHNDLIDLIIQSSQKTVDVKNEDGTINREYHMDTDSLWCKPTPYLQINLTIGF